MHVQIKKEGQIKFTGPLASITGFFLLIAFAWVIPQLPHYISFNAPTLTAQVAGAPNVSLIPLRTSGVAPLAVFFDATGTTDPSTSRPFLDLHYVWDFGDPSAGTWQFSGKSKNSAIGGVAGHLFTTPGTYTVRLTVTNAAGQSTQRTTTITVENPDTVFSGTNTRCVSSSGNFSGCPAGAQQVTSSSFNTQLLNTAGRRTLFRRGESFSFTSPVSLVNAGATGSSVGVFPSSGTAKAILNAQGTSHFSGGTNWRISDIFLNGTGTLTSDEAFRGGGISRLTVNNVNIERYNQCGAINGSAAPSAEIAFIDVICKNFVEPGDSTKFFEDMERSMIMGMEIDKGDAILSTDETEFNHRMVFFDKKVLQHNKYHGRSWAGRNTLSMRHCNATWGSKCINGVTKGQYMIVSDNHFIEEGGPAVGGYVLRVCSDSTCASNSQANNTFPIENVILERNLIQSGYYNPSIDQFASVFEIQSGLTAIRNNVIDFQRPALVGGNMAVILRFKANALGASYQNNVSFTNNTIYFNTYSKPITVCSAPIGTGHICNNNLVYTQNYTGTITLSTGSGWTSTAGNINATSNPFQSIPGYLIATPQSVPSFFSLSASSPALNTGITIPNMSTTDFSGLTIRTGAWDVGAFESGGGGTPPPPPPTDSTNPNVSLTAPSNNATVSGTVSIIATASDNVAVQSVTFAVDGTTVNTDTSSPYSYSWNSTTVANGSHTIRATATDTNNNTAQTQITVTVSNTTAPVCGNNIREGTEVCDGTQLNGQSCTTQGYTGGTLSCNTSCSAFVTSACTNTPPPPTGGNECTDGSDNDGDGRIDVSDNGCTGDINEFTERFEAPIGMNGVSLARWLVNETVITFSDVFNGSASAGSVPGLTYNQTWAPYLTSSINTASTGVTLPINRNDYPTQIPYDPDGTGPLPSVVARTVMLRNQYAPAGTYTLSFDGVGRIRVSGAAAVQECVGTGGTTNCSITVTPASTGIILHILESNVSNPITRIAVVVPGQVNNYRTQPFYPTFLARMGSFPVIRFMETMQTNHYPCDNGVTGSDPSSNPACVTLWSARVLPTQVQSGRRGIAWEYAVDMANATQADMWINIPHAADDDYVRNLARLIRDRLNRNRKVYLELSNEAWNGSFAQARYFRALGLQRGYDTNEVLAGRKAYARRLSEVIQIFETEFGTQQNRLIRVAGGHLPSPSVVSGIISYFNTTTYNPTGRRLDAISPQFYFGEELTDSATVDSVIARASTYTDGLIDGVRNHATIANQNGLKLFAYEGGQHFLSNGSSAVTQTLINANRDARMGTAVRRVIDEFLNNGGDLFMYFINVRYPGSAGAFGALEYMDQPIAQAPKFSAILAEIAERTSVTPPPTGTITSLTISPTIEGGSLSGRSFTFAIHSAGSQTALVVRSLTGGTNSTITVAGLSLNNGTYDFYLSEPNHLRRRVTITVTNGSTITFPRLLAGDLNNDRSINVLDWDIMRTQWGTNNLTSDVNRDGVVNSIDFSYLNKNWMTNGE